MKTQSIKIAIVQFTYDSGKSEIRPMSVQQLAGLKKAKIRKTIISKSKLATIEVIVKIQNQPL